MPCQYYSSNLPNFLKHDYHAFGEAICLSYLIFGPLELNWESDEFQAG